MTAQVWTEELKQEAINEYTVRIQELPEDERPQHSMRIIEELAAELGFSKNQVRGVVQHSPNYVKAGKPKPAAGATSTADKPKRVSKADAQANLANLISEIGQEPDMGMIEKMSGVQATYIYGVLKTYQLTVEEAE